MQAHRGILPGAMAIPLPIETERLILRRFDPDGDSGPMLAVYGDLEVMRFIPGGAYPGLDAVRTRLARYAHEHDSLGFSFWAVVERRSGEVIGDAGFGVFRDTGDVELGYSLKRDRWGRGFATEAARSCLAAGFAHLDVRRIVALVDEENARSARVAERIGMARIGTVRGTNGRPHALFAVSDPRAPQEEDDQPGQPRDDREDEQPLDDDDRQPDRQHDDYREQQQAPNVH
jgi:[ribosomal protein S5]-alanine N-acetyltransferase